MLRKILRGMRGRLRDLGEGRRVKVRGPRGLEFRWIVDRRFPQAMAAGAYEQELLEEILDVLEPGDAFLDVGANAGYVSLCAKIRVGEGKVVAFEPVPDNVRMIRRIQAANPRHPFDVEAIAVAASKGVVELEVPRNLANAHLRDVRWSQTKPAERTITVPTVGLQEYIDRDRPKAVKIDAEGAESLILGALRTIDTWPVKPTFFVEVHGRDNAVACRHVLVGWSYSVSRLGGGELSELDSGKVPPGTVLVARPPKP